MHTIDIRHKMITYTIDPSLPDTFSMLSTCVDEVMHYQFFDLRLVTKKQRNLLLMPISFFLLQAKCIKSNWQYNFSLVPTSVLRSVGHYGHVSSYICIQIQKENHFIIQFLLNFSEQTYFGILILISF